MKRYPYGLNMSGGISEQASKGKSVYEPNGLSGRSLSSFL